MKWIVGLVAVAACGKVSNKPVDAPVQHDSPGGGSDAPKQMDAPAVGATAIAADDITPFTMANVTFTKVPYVSVAYDDLSEYDMTSSTFTAKAAGDYLICASLYLNNFSVRAELDLYKNGTRDRGFAEGFGVTTGCRVIRLAAGDAIDVEAWQNSGSNLSPTADANWNWLTIQRVTATAMIENTANMSVASATFTTIPFANEIFDDASQFDPATSKFTAKAAGDYLMCAAKDISPNVRGEADVFVNGTRERGFALGPAAITGCHSVRLAAGDAVDIELYQQSVATASMTADVSWDWMTVVPQTASVAEIGITGFSAPAQVFTKVPYSTEAFDANGEFDVGTNTFTAATAGDYLVCASLASFTTTDGDELDIYKNGVREKGLHFGQAAITGCRVLRLAHNDQIQIEYYRPGAVTFSSDANWDYLTVSKLR